MENIVNRRKFLKLSAFVSTSIFINMNFFGINSFFNLKSNENGEIYHFEVGDFKCICINDGGYNYKPEDFFKNVPKKQIEEVLRKAGLPIDFIYTPYTHLIVNTGNHRVLVDMGGGKIISNNGKLPPTMKSAGIDPNDIDTIFITHAHPDHIGGTLDDNGEPIYGNARYFIWKDEWDFWFSEAATEKFDEFFIKAARGQLGPVKDRMNFVEKESEILPGIQVIAAPGHTPGHMVISFSSGDKQLYYIGDTVISPFHMEHPDWIPIYDLLPKKAAESKRKILNLVSEKKALVIGQHLTPFPSLGHVIKKGNGWLWQPIEKKN